MIHVLYFILLILVVVVGVVVLVLKVSFKVDYREVVIDIVEAF